MEILNKLKNLDAYPKINEDFYNRTLSGGLITIFSSISILILFFSEFRLYLNAVTESMLTVDISKGETLRINIERFLQRHGGRLDHNETYRVSCFGAEVVQTSLSLSISKDMNVVGLLVSISKDINVFGYV